MLRILMAIKNQMKSLVQTSDQTKPWHKSQSNVYMMLILFNTLRLGREAHTFSYYHSMILSYCVCVIFSLRKTKKKMNWLLVAFIYATQRPTDQQTDPTESNSINFDFIIFSADEIEKKNETKCLHGTVTNEINVNASLFDLNREKKMNRKILFFSSTVVACVHREKRPTTMATTNQWTRKLTASANKEGKITFAHVVCGVTYLAKRIDTHWKYRHPSEWP